MWAIERETSISRVVAYLLETLPKNKRGEHRFPTPLCTPKNPVVKLWARRTRPDSTTYPTRTPRSAETVILWTRANPLTLKSFQLQPPQTYSRCNSVILCPSAKIAVRKLN
jgi:hypothetical protein